MSLPGGGWPSNHYVTASKIAAFNRALFARLPEILVESDIAATHVALQATFVMPEGAVLTGQLIPAKEQS